MFTKELRGNDRTPSQESVALGWDDSAGQPKFVLANCLNVSVGGLSVRVNQPMPARTYVRLRSAKLNLAVTATVKYCIRSKSWYQIGLEFTQRPD